MKLNKNFCFFLLFFLLLIFFLNKFVLALPVTYYGNLNYDYENLSFVELKVVSNIENKTFIISKNFSKFYVLDVLGSYNSLVKFYIFSQKVMELKQLKQASLVNLNLSFKRLENNFSCLKNVECISNNCANFHCCLKDYVWENNRCFLKKSSSNNKYKKILNLDSKSNFKVFRKNLSKNSKLKIKFKSEIYSLKLNKIFENKVNFNFYPTSSSHFLEPLEFIKKDLDSDNFYDIFVQLIFVNSSFALFEIKKIYEKINFNNNFKNDSFKFQLKNKNQINFNNFDKNKTIFINSKNSINLKNYKINKSQNQSQNQKFIKKIEKENFNFENFFNLNLIFKEFFLFFISFF